MSDFCFNEICYHFTTAYNGIFRVRAWKEKEMESIWTDSWLCVHSSPCDTRISRVTSCSLFKKKTVLIQITSGKKGSSSKYTDSTEGLKKWDEHLSLIVRRWIAWLRFKTLDLSSMCLVAGLVLRYLPFLFPLKIVMLCVCVCVWCRPDAPAATVAKAKLSRYHSDYSSQQSAQEGLWNFITF